MRALFFLLFSLSLHATDYVIFAGYGQSLGRGELGTPVLSSPQPFSNKTVNSPGTSLLALQPQSSVYDSQEFPDFAFANTATSLGETRPVIMSNWAQTGAGYDALTPGTPCNVPKASRTGVSTYYANLVLKTQQAYTLAKTGSNSVTVGGMLFTHGEHDFSADMDAATYQADLECLQQAFEIDAKAITSQSGTVPLYISQMNSWNPSSNLKPGGSPTPTTAGGAQGTPLGQWSAAKANPGKIILCGAKYLYFANRDQYISGGSATQGTQPDGIHLQNDSYRHLGSLYAKFYDAIRRGTSQPWPLSPIPGQITVRGATVTLPLRGNIGPVVLDTSTWTQRNAGYGLEWFDDSGAPVTISSVSAAGTSTLIVTLSGPPTGTVASWRLRNAYTGTKGATTVAGGIARSNIRDSDTTVGINGDVLRNWLITFDETVAAANGIFPLPSGR